MTPLTAADHVIFVTGRLAEPSLARVLRDTSPTPFTYEIRVLGVAVAALLTSEMIVRRIGDLGHATRVIVPGRCRGDMMELTARLGVPCERGPEELKDLPQLLGGTLRAHDLSRHDCLIFAEIVDAPQLTIDGCLARAARYRADGADVIDVGCLPDTAFPHLEECVQALRTAGYRVSVDSLNEDELARGARAGADYLFSLSEDSLWLVEESAATPILIGRDPRDLDSLGRAVETLVRRNRPFFADPILDPIHHGFVASLLRYHEMRRRYPDIPLMMGVGNLSELTHTDSLGLNVLLMGVISELNITALLTTEVSGHCRTAVRELDHARRVMFAAREDKMPPRHIDEGLLALHARKPFPYTPEEIAAFAREVKDANYRIQIAADGIHVYNRDGHYVAPDPYDIFPQLGVADDGAHAFYLGLELARAQVAWQLGKRYEQDEELDWGCVRPRPRADLRHFAAERTTLAARRTKRGARKSRGSSKPRA